MLEARAASFTKRSIKTSAKLHGLLLAMSMIDLTTLEGKDSPEKVRSLCRKAVRPYDRDELDLGMRVPSVAAVCVYPSLVPIAKETLEGSTVKIAAVATGFPSGQYPLSVRLQDTRDAVEAGADEIDMVINRGAFLSGRYAEVGREIEEVKAACGDAHLKVILETGELETYDNIRRASDLAILLSDAEGISNFLLETMASGLPSLTTGPAAITRDAERDQWSWIVGRTAPIEDDAGRILTQLEHAASGLKTKGSAARKKVEEDFSMDKVATAYEKLYHTMTGT